MGLIVALAVLCASPSGAWAAMTVTPLSKAEGDSGPTAFAFAYSGAPLIAAGSSCTITGETAAVGEDVAASGSGGVALGSGTCTINVAGDTTVEQNETFEVTVTVSGESATATGTILNDDLPAVSSVSAPRAGEASGAAAFTVALQAPDVNPVTVDYATHDGSATAPADYTTAAGTLTFDPGETTKTVTVPIADDRLSEGDETFTLTAGAVTGTATIADDEPPLPFVGAVDAAVKEGDAGTTPLTFAVLLSNPSPKPVSVQVATQSGTAEAGSDFTALAPTTITFAPGETVKQVTVPIVGDTVPEPDETFTLVMARPVNAAFAGARTAALGGIFNDDGKLDTTDPRVRLGAPRWSEGRVLVRLTCPASERSCAGRITVFTKPDRRSRVRALRRERRLGAGAFTLAGGRSATVRIRPAKTLRRLLPRARRVTVTAFAVTRDAAGNVDSRHVSGVLKTR